MYAALLNQNLVLAIDEARAVLRGEKALNREPYYCPHCRQRMVLVIAQKKSAFFKHLPQYQPLMGGKAGASFG